MNLLHYTFIHSYARIYKKNEIFSKIKNLDPCYNFFLTKLKAITLKFIFEKGFSLDELVHFYLYLHIIPK